MKKLMTILIGLSFITVPVSAQDAFSVAFISRDSTPDRTSYVNNALEGMLTFVRENALSEEENYVYLPAETEEEYSAAFDEAVQGDHDLVISLGTTTAPMLEEFARNNPDTNFMMIDDAVEEPNVTSIIFRDYEVAFLAGVAAAMETEADHVGFIGAQADNQIVAQFEQGFLAGVNEVNPDVQVETLFLEGFDDLNGAREATTTLIDNGADIIYHAAGDDASRAIIDEIHEVKQANLDTPIWMIGSNYDQTEEGIYMNAETQEANFILTSTVKDVGQVIEQYTQQAYDGELQPGIHEIGMAEGVIDILAGQLEGETYETVNDYREQIMQGSLNVAELTN